MINAEDILNEILNDKEISEMFLYRDDENVFFKIFVCMAIRNKYLWHNQFNTKLLMEYFKCDHVDDISSEIYKMFLTKFL